MSGPVHAGQPDTPLWLPAGILFGRGLRLIHDGATQRWAVCLGGLVLDSWADGDVASQRLAMARLVNGQLARAMDIAQVFGVHRNTVSRIAREVEAGGATAVIRRKPGPRRRHKVTTKALGVLREAVARGWTIMDSQAEVRRTQLSATARPCASVSSSGGRSHVWHWQPERGASRRTPLRQAAVPTGRAKQLVNAAWSTTTAPTTSYSRGRGSRTPRQRQFTCGETLPNA